MVPSNSFSCAGVLCIPFPDPTKAEGRNQHLRRLEDWITAAASEAEVDLAPVRGSYDSTSDVIAQIYDSIRSADLVIGVVDEVNPNVFYECGFAVGWGLPVLYVCQQGEKAPFDIAGIEHFAYADLTTTEQSDLADAIRACLDSARNRPQLAQPLRDAAKHFADYPAGAPRLFSSALRHVLTGVGAWLTSMSPASFSVMGAGDILAAGTHILSNLATHGFATQYYSGQASWRTRASKGTRDDYFSATREAVREGRDITRVYVLDDLEQLEETAFRETVIDDVRAGVDTQYILLSQLPDPEARDFAIWDDELVADVEYVARDIQSLSLQQCTYHCDLASRQRASDWRRQILRHAVRCPDLPSERSLLERSAFTLSQDWADHCTQANGSANGCVDYHLPWQMLKLCGMVSTPAWHASFYRKAITSWCIANDGDDPLEPRRVLITGLADYGMLYWLIQSLPPDVRSTSEFHVLDICQTPLESCAWLRAELERQIPGLRLNLTLHHEDLLDHRQPDGVYDLVLSDAFLTRFTQYDDKKDVMTEWLRVLRPGGRLFTTARIRSGLDDINDSHRQAFIFRAIERAQDLDLDTEHVKVAATAYSSYVSSFPFDDAAHVRSFLNTFSDQTSYVEPDCTSLSVHEMVPAYYARIQVERL